MSGEVAPRVKRRLGIPFVVAFHALARRADGPIAVVPCGFDGEAPAVAAARRGRTRLGVQGHAAPAAK